MTYAEIEKYWQSIKPKRSRAIRWIKIRTAIRKQIAAEPMTYVWLDGGTTICCPRCGTAMASYHPRYCWNCGQKLSWKGVVRDAE